MSEPCIFEDEFISLSSEKGMSLGAQQKEVDLPGGCVTERPVIRQLEKWPNLFGFDLERIGSLLWAHVLCLSPEEPDPGNL